jgi:hypothetical protein
MNIYGVLQPHFALNKWQWKLFGHVKIEWITSEMKGLLKKEVHEKGLFCSHLLFNNLAF